MAELHAVSDEAQDHLTRTAQKRIRDQSNSDKLKALHDSVLLSLLSRASTVFVTVIALPFGIWLGARMIDSMDTLAIAVQTLSERMVRVETKLEFLQRNE